MFSVLLRQSQTNYFSVSLRHYATKSVRISNVNYDAAPGEVPALIPGKAGEVAMTFFENVWKNGGDIGVKTFESELNILVWSIRKDEEWELIQSPLVSLQEKNQIVTSRLKKLGCSEYFVTQILSLVQNDNLSRLNQIRYDFEEIMRAYRREIDVTLVTKTSLPEDVLEYYKRTIRLNYLSPKDNIIFTHHVDPSITHGYRIELGGQIFDFTWNADKQKMQNKFTEISQKYHAEVLENINQPIPDWDAAIKVLDPESKFDSPLFKVAKPSKIKLPEALGGHQVYKIH